ncbi:MAG: hypothetical protein ACRD6N_13120, partial [Pyrinomonadaceae bacterium]
PLSLACGPFTLSAIFTFTVHPEYPLEKFASGDIGVLQPTYARSYLYVAYRHLIGAGFNQQEQRALVDLWRARLDFKWQTDGQDWVQEWLAARGKVPGVSPAPKIEVYRSREKPNEYETYLNCQDDAFNNAAATLNARIAKLGAEHSLIKDWVAAQDEVFANCSEGQHIPPAAPSDADSLIRSDRTYQVAAANFYSSNFAEAKTLFESISRDSDSPWQKTASYLIARTLVREASLGAPEKKNESLAAAEKQLNGILKTQTLSESHAAAKRLLSVVRVRLHPEKRLHELAHSLMGKNQNEDLKQNLWDYTILLDQFLGDDDQKKAVPFEVRNDELTDWVVTFQSMRPESLEHALERWQTKASVPWLIAALSKIDADHPKTHELLVAASALSPDSTAFPSAFFHTVRLAMQANRFDEARSSLDDVLQKHRNRLTVSGLNLALSQRILLAKSLDDFLTNAQRIPAAFSWNDDGREIPTEESEQSEETKSMRGKPLFDIDAAQLLNRSFPLDLWRKAAESKVLSTHLRRDVAQAAWIRAVVLGDTKTADELAPTLKGLIPELSSFLDDYLSTTSPDAKRFSAIYTWLKFPGLEPTVDAGIGRQTSLAEQDSYRDNWWCSAAYSVETETEESTGQEMLKIGGPFNAVRQGMVPVFLTGAQRAAGQREFAILDALGAGPNYLCQQAIQWSTKSPTDPRVPEALHLTVKSTRYGCTDKDTPRWSKAAFDVLHKRYPRSTWAKKTPYWFKD